jgi:hypothetical protein
MIFSLIGLAIAFNVFTSVRNPVDLTAQGIK